MLFTALLCIKFYKQKKSEKKKELSTMNTSIPRDPEGHRVPGTYIILIMYNVHGPEK